MHKQTGLGLRCSGNIPPAVLQRLPRYLAQVQILCARGVTWVSSAELADKLSLTSSTVRHDLRHVEFSGISKRGYETAGLRAALERMLGADVSWNVAVVGAGNLGRALALHEEFVRRGFIISALFDSDKKKIGRRFGQLKVRGMDQLPQTIVQNKIDIGVIAVPASAAQRVADLLIASGIRGLLNLSSTHIIAPRQVPVVDARIVASLQELAHLIRIRGREGSARRSAPSTGGAMS